MKNDFFEVDKDLFQSKPTEAPYLLSASQLKPGEINAVYIDIDENGNIKTESLEVADNVFTRRIIKREKIDTFMKIIDLNDWQYACAIYDMDRKLYDIDFSKRINMILATLGLSSPVMFGKGLSLLQHYDSSAYGFLFIGGVLILISLSVANKYFNLAEESKNLKLEKENLILDRGYKLVRKK